jgi:hypothetical protein
MLKLIIFYKVHLKFYFVFLIIVVKVALRIRPMKSDEKNRGYRVVAEKVDDKVRLCFISHHKTL